MWENIFKNNYKQERNCGRYKCPLVSALAGAKPSCNMSFPPLTEAGDMSTRPTHVECTGTKGPQAPSSEEMVSHEKAG